jgi:hypothetical protein
VTALPAVGELVELHQDAPFTMIGINTDSDKDDYTKKAKDAGVTWRNAWMGFPIGEVFGVSGYPTVILIDKDGVARWQGHFFEGNAEFDALLAELIAEAELAAQ